MFLIDGVSMRAQELLAITPAKHAISVEVTSTPVKKASASTRSKVLFEVLFSLSGSLAVLNSRYPPGPGPEPPQIRPKTAGIVPPGPKETLGFHRGKGRPRWGTASATLRVSRSKRLILEV